MTIEAGEADDGVYFTEQEPLVSLHESAENLPEPVVDHETFPVGDDPVTLTESLTVEPTTTVGIGLDISTGDLDVDVTSVTDDEVAEVPAGRASDVVLSPTKAAKSCGAISTRTFEGAVDAPPAPEAAGAMVRAAEQEATSKTVIANTVSLLRGDALLHAGPPHFKA